MKPIRFIMIGGFLGAGKTTAIARLARHYMDQGASVGVVTNDQAYDLVDTQSLRAQGFRVGEVPGACFCCKFDDLVETTDSLAADETPDVIITEPVGSCTDLVATVIEPLRSLHGDRYEIAPLAVLLKPEHGRKILAGGEGAGFSPKAAYIFLKQIEEADVVCVNKIDKLSAAECDELLRLVNEQFPDKQVIATSGREGAGFDELIAALADSARPHESFMEVDYDVYAEGEAELGWLNCQAMLAADAERRFSVDAVVVRLVERLRDGLHQLGAEPAHLKVLAQAGAESAIANLVDSAHDVELSIQSAATAAQADLTVNARVAMDPEQLEQVVLESISDTASQFELRAEVRGMQRFRPGRPTPTHRMS